MTENKIYQFILHLVKADDTITDGIMLVKSPNLEASIACLEEKMKIDYPAIRYEARYVQCQDVDRMISELGLNTKIVFQPEIVPEEPKISSLAAMAKYLRANGYSVKKK